MPKRRFAVMTDSSCDLTPETVEKCNIDILPFQITVDGVGYTEREDFGPDEYYEMLRNCAQIPSTAHVTTPRFLAQFETYDDAGVEQVLYVSINASGSNTYNAAVLAKEAFHQSRPGSNMQIYLVDSHSYSVAFGVFLAEAARKLQNGAEMGDVVEWLEDVFSRLEIVLAAYTLKFMKKSGRINAAAAFAGELLGLRPVVTLIDGESVVRKKVRGDKDVIPACIEYASAHIDDTFTWGVAGTKQAYIDEMAAAGRKAWKCDPVDTGQLGAAVATNTGPEAIAVYYLGPKRPR